MRRVLLSLALLVGAATTAQAQSIDDEGLWFAAFANGSVCDLGWEHDQLLWWFDCHARFLDDADGFNQSIVRPGLGIRLDEDSALWAGYGWIRTSPITGTDFDEHRLWQQWTWSPSHGDLSFLVRSRLEQRWLEQGDDIGLRWRQLLRAQKTLCECPKTTFVVWDEVFIHLNDTDWGARAGLNQNRAFVGFGYKPCPDSKWRTEIGYLNQAINLPGDPDRFHHILSVNFFR